MKAKGLVIFCHIFGGILLISQITLASEVEYKFPNGSRIYWEPIEGRSSVGLLQYENKDGSSKVIMNALIPEPRFPASDGSLLPLLGHGSEELKSFRRKVKQSPLIMFEIAGFKFIYHQDGTGRPFQLSKNTNLELFRNRPVGGLDLRTIPVKVNQRAYLAILFYDAASPDRDLYKSIMIVDENLEFFGQALDSSIPEQDIEVDLSSENGLLLRDNENQYVLNLPAERDLKRKGAEERAWKAVTERYLQWASLESLEKSKWMELISFLKNSFPTDTVLTAESFPKQLLEKMSVHHLLELMAQEPSYLNFLINSYAHLDDNVLYTIALATDDAKLLTDTATLLVRAPDDDRQRRLANILLKSDDLKYRGVGKLFRFSECVADVAALAKP
ncbi:MAG: hypothetical protein JWQ35_476 [Bacteriovoracaceae bacterium]|nr:hypothetical protein [Bacteriovoracaceae bacterium]